MIRIVKWVAIFAASDPRNLLSTMLYAVPDAAGLAAQTALRGDPGNSLDYQTVHSVLLQEVIRNVIDDDQAYFGFPEQALFGKLGMANSFFQADATGTVIGLTLYELNDD